MEKTNPINFDIVADIYDSYVNVTADIPFFIKETEGVNDEILELMCGTGRVSIPLLEDGRKLVCVDYSDGMLEAFKKKIEEKNFPVEITQADVTQLNLKRKFKFILLPFHSLSEILEKEKQAEALRKIDGHLEQGGTFICALQNPNIRLKTADGIKYTLGEFDAPGNTRLHVSYSNRWDSKRELVTGFQYYEFYDAGGKILEKRTMEINFRLIRDSEFKKMIRNTGMTIKEIYGDYSHSSFDEHSSPFMIYKLIKM